MGRVGRDETTQTVGIPTAVDEFRITGEELLDVDQLLTLLKRGARLADDPAELPTVQSSDPDDDDLVALAETSRAVIVSGDRHLLDLAESIPVHTPAEFVQLLEEAL